jgi:hypothetical protein
LLSSKFAPTTIMSPEIETEIPKLSNVSAFGALR